MSARPHWEKFNALIDRALEDEEFRSILQEGERDVRLKALREIGILDEDIEALKKDFEILIPERQLIIRFWM